MTAPLTTSHQRWPTHPVTATIIGVLCAGITVMLLETAGHALFGVGDPRSPGGITTLQYAAVLIAWILGAAVGAMIATRWSRTRSVIPGVIVGTFILLGAVANFTAFAHPTWMMVASAGLPFVGFVAARAAGARTR
jgi:hypothetical protein